MLKLIFTSMVFANAASIKRIKKETQAHRIVGDIVCVLQEAKGSTGARLLT